VIILFSPEQIPHAVLDFAFFLASVVSMILTLFLDNQNAVNILVLIINIKIHTINNNINFYFL